MAEILGPVSAGGVTPDEPDLHRDPSSRRGKVAVRLVIALAVGLALWGAWQVVELAWAARSIEHVDFGLDDARQALARLSDADRPPEPPDDPPPDDGTGTPTSVSPPAPDPDVDPNAPLVDDLPPPASGEVIPDEAFDAYLIVGSDARAGLGGSRADVIILALIPSDGSAPILASLPRDLWIYNPCWDRPRRINVSLNGCGSAASGPELLALTVADFTGIEPDHFALFDFEEFKQVIDAFGGTRICVTNPVRDLSSGLDLPEGCTRANGETALSWVRSRHTEQFTGGEWVRMRGVSDLTRNARQRDVLLQLLGRVRSFSTITRLTNIVDSIADSVTVDDGLSISASIQLAWDLRDVSPGDVREITIPVSNYRTEGGAAVLLPDATFADVLAEVWPAGS